MGRRVTFVLVGPEAELGRVAASDVFSWVVTRRPPFEQFAPFLENRTPYLSFATVGEVWKGAANKSWGDKRKAELGERLRTNFVVVQANYRTTELWGQMAAKLGGHLKAGGVNDMWTAACALTQDPPLPVITGNLTDFETISAEFGVELVHPDL